MTNTPISASSASPASNSRTEKTDSNCTLFKAIRDKIPCILPDLDHAIRTSTIDALDGTPYPIVFRNQGALDEWRRLYNSSRWGQHIWHRLSDVESTYIECMHEVHWQFEQHLGPCPRDHDAVDRYELLRANAIQWAANIHYECKRGALIETTPVLDTLLLHSDLDDTLPMRFFAPPYAAQYLRLTREVADQFATEDDKAHRRWIDGIFCFLTPAASSATMSEAKPVLELVIVYNNHEAGIGTYTMHAPIRSPDQTVGQWVSAISLFEHGRPAAADDDRIQVINYLVKVFLYLGLKDARKTVCTEYSTALKQLAARGPNKQARLQRRLDALYDRVTVGPVSLPPSPTAGNLATQVAPHWRRGHFRLQAHGPARSERKLIFVAPILVHAGKLNDEAPRPKAYALTAGSFRA